MKRLTVGIGALTTLLLLAGCVGFITGDEPLAFESAPADISEDVQDDTGFMHETTDDIAFNETVSYGEQEREVRLSNWNTEFRKSISSPLLAEDQEVARFVVFTTPEVEVFGQSLNPVNELARDEVVQYVADQYKELGDLERVDEHTVETLGEEVTVVKYSTTVEMEGEEFNAYLHMAQTTHEGDHIVALGFYPEQFDEEENIYTLIENIEHENNSDE